MSVRKSWFELSEKDILDAFEEFYDHDLEILDIEWDAGLKQLRLLMTGPYQPVVEDGDATPISMVMICPGRMTVRDYEATIDMMQGIINDLRNRT